MATVVRGTAVVILVWGAVVLGQGAAAQGDEPYPPLATATVAPNPPQARWRLGMPMIWRE